MKEAIGNRKKYGKIISKAWQDEDFKKRLLTDSHRILAENDIDVPEGVTVRFVEVGEKEILISLPPRPANTDTLSDDELQSVSAGSIGAYTGVIY